MAPMVTAPMSWNRAPVATISTTAIGIIVREIRHGISVAIRMAR